MNTVLFVNATIGFSENLFLVTLLFNQVLSSNYWFTFTFLFPWNVPFYIPFLVLQLILIHAIHELPLTQPVLNLELAQVVHPVMLSQHHELFELLHELPHMLITVLHA